MNFKTLLWKEYRQSRHLLLSCIVLLLFPYLVVVVIWLVGVLKYDQPLEETWAHSIAFASMTSLITSAILTPFAAAQVMAAERADRSAEFAGYLPIARAPGVAAKIVFAVGISAFMLVANGLVGVWCYAVAGTRPDSYGSEVTGLLVPSVVAAVLMFGVSWLVSTLSARTSVGAASGLGAVIVLLFLIMLAEEFGVGGPRTIEREIASLFLGAGIACFLAGVVCYLRRIEP